MFQPTLVPAFGRDYKSKKDLLADLNAGKDFLCEPHGSYINLEGIIREGWKNISVRYKKMTQQVIVNVVNGKLVDGYK